MGGALIRGLIARGLAPQNISVGKRYRRDASRWLMNWAYHVSADNLETVDGADIVVLAVKPQDMGATVRPLAGTLAKRKPLVLSIAAGIRVADIAGWCGPGIAVVRAMPNRPALNNAGATAIYGPAGVSEAHRRLAEDVLGAVGNTVWVPSEDALDVVTALSGSGPAYFFLLAELMTDAAVGLGLTRASARSSPSRRCSARAAWRATATATWRGLRAEVTSKGGTTEAAVRAFDAANLRGIVAAALAAATDRGREMAQAFGQNWARIWEINHSHDRRPVSRRRPAHALSLRADPAFRHAALPRGLSQSNRACSAGGHQPSHHAAAHGSCRPSARSTAPVSWPSCSSPRDRCGHAADRWQGVLLDPLTWPALDAAHAGAHVHALLHRRHHHLRDPELGGSAGYSPPMALLGVQLRASARGRFAARFPRLAASICRRCGSSLAFGVMLRLLPAGLKAQQSLK
jgi:pyrroline-5-carboxylate reductase